jgi:hypothetical protein
MRNIKRLTADETSDLVRKINKQVEQIALLEENDCPPAKIAERKEELYKMCVLLQGASFAPSPSLTNQCGPSWRCD